MAALGNDRDELVGKFLAVNEFHGSNANFILTSLMIDFLKKGQGLCFVSLHNSLGHYHHILMKMSNLNLYEMEENNKVETIELMRECREHMSCKEKCSHLWSEDNKFSVEKLYLRMKSKVLKLLESHSSVFIIVDDLSHLLDFGVPLRDVASFLHYLRTLLTLFSKVSLVVLTHLVEDDEYDTLMANINHTADVIVNTTILKTGHSSDVSGVMEVREKQSDKQTINSQNNSNMYHFKLLDRQVKLYAPGTSMLRTF